MAAWFSSKRVGLN